MLLPLAGLDTTGIALYFTVLQTKSKLNYVRNDVARGLFSGTMSEEEALRWLQDYGLQNQETAKKSISFIRSQESYVINYNYGADLVAQYIERMGGTNPEDRWRVFEKLLSNQIRIKDLKNNWNWTLASHQNLISQGKNPVLQIIYSLFYKGWQADMEVCNIRNGNNE